MFGWESYTAWCVDLNWNIVEHLRSTFVLMQTFFQVDCTKVKKAYQIQIYVSVLFYVSSGSYYKLAEYLPSYKNTLGFLNTEN